MIPVYIKGRWYTFVHKVVKGPDEPFFPCYFALDMNDTRVIRAKLDCAMRIMSGLPKITKQNRHFINFNHDFQSTEFWDQDFTLTLNSGKIQMRHFATPSGYKIALLVVAKAFNPEYSGSSLGLLFKLTHEEAGGFWYYRNKYNDDVREIMIQNLEFKAINCCF